MGKLLSSIIIWTLSSFLVKIFATLGIAIFTYKSLETLVQSLLTQLDNHISGMPEAVATILGMAGLDVGLTIITSAILTGAAIKSAKAFVGVV